MGVGKILTYCKSAEIHYADACNSANIILELHKLEKVGNHKVQMLSWCKLIVMQLDFSRLGSLSLSVSGKISHHLPSCSTLYSQLLNTTNLTKKPHLPGRHDCCRAAMYLRSMVDKSGNDIDRPDSHSTSEVHHCVHFRVHISKRLNKKAQQKAKYSPFFFFFFLNL